MNKVKFTVSGLRFESHWNCRNEECNFHNVYIVDLEGEEGQMTSKELDKKMKCSFCGEPRVKEAEDE